MSDLVDPDSTGDVADFGCGICAVHPHDGGTCGEGWCDTLRLLAMPYADHPDYQQEWRERIGA